MKWDVTGAVEKDLGFRQWIKIDMLQAVSCGGPIPRRTLHVDLQNPAGHFADSPRISKSDVPIIKIRF
jgi:hypothetical protein